MRRNLEGYPLSTTSELLQAQEQMEDALVEDMDGKWVTIGG